MRVRIATRGSPLARWQAGHVAELLAAADPSLAPELVVVRTEGDQRAGVPIWQLGGKGAFVNEVRAAVLDGAAELAVHSAKDLPAAAVPGLWLASVPRRADVRDVLVGSTLDGLPTGALVATGSARRRVQLASARPDLRFTGLRGNVATRLDAVGTNGVQAVVGSAAALGRLGLSQRIDEVLATSVMVPQVGQGALAVECADGVADRLRAALAAVEHAPSRRAVDAERAFLAELGGDCDLPAGALAVGTGAGADGVVAGDGAGGTLALSGMLASLDGHVVLHHTVQGAEPLELGRSVARYLLDSAGGASLGWLPPLPGS